MFYYDFWRELFYIKATEDAAMEGEMHYYFWLLDHPAALLALGAGTILAFAWPLHDVYSGAVAVAMMVVAAGLAIWAYFHSPAPIAPGQ